MYLIPHAQCQVYNTACTARAYITVSGVHKPLLLTLREATGGLWLVTICGIIAMDTLWSVHETLEDSIQQLTDYD